MQKLLLPVHPEYAEKIFAGVKRYEYRKFRCRRDIEHIVIYATAPAKRVIGEARIAGVVCGDPLAVWAATSDLGPGIMRREFDAYYGGAKLAFAYRLADVAAYDRPLELTEIGLRRAPQGHAYIETEAVQ